jgi:hypothetical protein
VYNDAADNLVDRLVATARENVKRCKAKLAGLNRRRKFILWYEVGLYARQLLMMLDDLKATLSLSYSDTALLIETANLNAAEGYLLNRAA